MIGNKKVIGVCVSRVHSICVNEFLSALHQKTRTQGIKIIVFNSPVDFYNNDNNDIGAGAVYKMINYDVLDALIIQAENFRNENVYLDIIKDAKAHGTPVLLLKKDNGGCPCIMNDYTEGFKALMDHVIKVHGAKDTVFFAGRKENDPESEKRIECYRQVLLENGLDFSYEQVEYGDYWSVPTVMALHRVLEKRGGKLPQAFFCANDYMAIALCEELERLGYTIPDDVIVTGFDGVREADYRIPQLSTCKEDHSALAAKALEIVKCFFEGRDVPDLTYNRFVPFFTESCGCDYHGGAPRLEAQRQYALVHQSLSHEEFVFGWLSTALEAKDLPSFMELLPKLILSLGYVCLNSDFMDMLNQNGDEGRASIFTQKMLLQCSQFAQRRPENSFFYSKDMIPEPELWASEEPKDDTIYVISAVNSGSEVYGTYAVRTSTVLTDSDNINRSLAAINIGFDSIGRYCRQRITLLGLKNAALTDHLTGLPNLKGTTAWFEELSLVPENHEKCLTISIYGIPKYKYIYENFGIKEIELSVRVVADLLKKANRDDAFIGRVADDEFLVINIYDSPDRIKGVIDLATSNFFGAITDYNVEQAKPYYLEVNAGCTELYPGWDGTLASFSKIAGNAMYLNRLHAQMGQTDIRKTLPTQVYKSFELLIENNLFDYHFQPIIDTKTADIIAYEALMRPHSSVNMTPEEVIQIAAQYSRLDDVEYATMFNVMERYKNDRESFKGRKVFINSIPGHFLHGDNYNAFVEKYRDVLDGIVIEITEGSTVSDADLKHIKGLIKNRIPIAIDDYGTGHSNIVNLLRYSPQIIKVDRFLISDIQDDNNKQMFFKSTVEFAHINNMKVLAEGVETAEELECVTKLGADLIQGFFTGRPAAKPLEDIPQDIKELILNIK